MGLPEKSVTWLPEIISGELIPRDYRKVWPGLRLCELLTNKDTGNIGNLIAGKNSGRINLEQLPEKSVIGNL